MPVNKGIIYISYKITKIYKKKHKNYEHMQWNCAQKTLKLTILVLIYKFPALTSLPVGSPSQLGVKAPVFIFCRGPLIPYCHSVLH